MEKDFFECCGFKEVDIDSDDCIIILDTNVYLNFYESNFHYFKNIIYALFFYKEKIWLPHQVSLEFYKNREKVINKVKKNHESLAEALKKNIKLLDTTVINTKKIDVKLDKQTIDSFKSSTNEIIKKLNGVSYDFCMYPPKDKVLKEILILFSKKRTGKPYSSKELLNIIKEGEIRYKHKIPPGFEDINKKENAFGDLILWKQMIACAKANKKSVLFITDDKKKDWWHKEDNTSVYLHPNLQAEFYADANKYIWSVSSIDFFKYLKKVKKLDTKTVDHWKLIIDNFMDLSDDFKLELEYSDFYLKKIPFISGRTDFINFSSDEK